MDIFSLSIKQLLSGLKKKEFSATEVVDAYHKRAAGYGGKIKAFLTETWEDAKKRAEEADEKIEDYGKDAFKQYPLLGIPVAHKDLYLTKDIRTTAGSKVLEDYIPVYSATVVNRLESAGSFIVGKLNCDAWGHGSSGENSDFFPTRNPWNVSYVPGGSSSGSAAAVAAGFVPVATGTDTGGSIRLPASFCGVVGLKPTYGRVSRYGIVAMASSLDSMGHITRTVEDSAIVLSITAGKDPYDATSLSDEAPDYSKYLQKGVKGLRIGLPKEYFSQGLAAQVKDQVQSAAQILEKLGAEIKEVSLPHTEYAIATYYVLMPSEVSSNLARYDGIRYGNDRSSFGQEAKRRIMIGTHALSSGYIDQYYNRARSVRNQIEDDFNQAFKKVDLLLAPVSPTPPFKLGEKTEDPLEMYLSDILTTAVNLSGLPALVVPCGQTENGLPIGMQLVGPKLSEGLLFSVGYAFEQETAWHKRMPDLK